MFSSLVESKIISLVSLKISLKRTIIPISRLRQHRQLTQQPTPAEPGPT